MTPGQLARVFDAGMQAIPENGATPAKVMGLVLAAMARECWAIDMETNVQPAYKPDGAERDARAAYRAERNELIAKGGPVSDEAIRAQQPRCEPEVLGGMPPTIPLFGD